MIEHRILSPLEKVVFRKRYESFDIGKISDEYLNKSIVRGFFDKSGFMVGGYIVHVGKDHSRYLSYIPNLADVELGIPLNSIVEISCMWMDKSIKNKNKRIYMYYKSMMDAKNTNAKYIIAGSTNTKLKKIQKFALPTDLWSGVGSHKQIQYVYYTESDKIFKNWIMGVPKYIALKSSRKLSNKLRSSKLLHGFQK